MPTMSLFDRDDPDRFGMGSLLICKTLIVVPQISEHQNQCKVNPMALAWESSQNGAVSYKNEGHYLKRDTLAIITCDVTYQLDTHVS